MIPMYPLALYYRALVLVLGASLSVVVLAGCSDDPAAVSPTDLPYTLYGILNPASDTQQVRVFPIEPKLLPNSGKPLDAVVTSTDLQTGQVLVWRDSILAFENGTYGYLFWAPFSPEGGHTYRLDVTRSDQAQSWATVVVPRLPQPFEPVHGSGVIIPVELAGNGAHLLRVNMEYTVSYGWGAPQKRMIRFPYVHQVYPGGNASLLDITLSTDFEAILDSLIRKGQFNPEYGVVPVSIELHAMVTDAGWNPPGDEIDPEILIEPGVFDNVENGFGFLGSGYAVRQPLTLTHEVLGAAGFTPVEPPPPPPGNGEPPPPV